MLVGIALGNLRREEDQAFVLQAANGFRRGPGKADELQERQFAPLLDDVPHFKLALGELGEVAGARGDPDMQALAPAGVFSAHRLRQHALEGDLRRAAIVVSDPARQRQHLGRHQRRRADDPDDGPELGEGGFLSQRGDDAKDLPSAKGHLDARPHVHLPEQFRRDGVIKLFPERDFQGDAGNHGDVIRNSGKQEKGWASKLRRGNAKSEVRSPMAKTGSARNELLARMAAAPQQSRPTGTISRSPFLCQCFGSGVTTSCR